MKVALLVLVTILLVVTLNVDQGGGYPQKDTKPLASHDQTKDGPLPDFDSTNESNERLTVPASRDDKSGKESFERTKRSSQSGCRPRSACKSGLSGGGASIQRSQRSVWGRSRARRSWGR